MEGNLDNDDMDNKYGRAIGRSETTSLSVFVDLLCVIADDFAFDKLRDEECINLFFGLLHVSPRTWTKAIQQPSRKMQYDETSSEVCNLCTE